MKKVQFHMELSEEELESMLAYDPFLKPYVDRNRSIPLSPLMLTTMTKLIRGEDLVA